MNILYIDHYAGSLRDGMEFRPYYLAREWIRQGHTVRVVGADYSHLRKVQPTVAHDFEREMIDGIEYQWVKAGTYCGNGLARAVTMLRFTAKLYGNAACMAKGFKPDAVITSSCYPLDSYAAVRIARKAKAKYIHEAHDLWPLTLIELGGMKPYHPFVLLIGQAEKYAMRHAEMVVSILPNACGHMMARGLRSAKRFVYIPNGIAAEDWQQTVPMPQMHQRLLDELHAQGRFVVGYLGGHAMSNALDVLLDAAVILKGNENIAIVLIGDGVEKQRLMEKARQQKLDNVHFLSPVEKRQVPSVLFGMDALYLGLAACPLYRFGVSMNKLYDYMMSSKPMLYGVQASNNEVEDARCGITVPAGDAAALANGIVQLADMDPKRRNKMGHNGYEWVTKNCEYASLAKIFLEQAIMGTHGATTK